MSCGDVCGPLFVPCFPCEKGIAFCRRGVLFWGQGAIRQKRRDPEKQGKKMKNEAETVDATPTWEAVLPIYLMAYENGKNKGRGAALEELQRMAKLADLYIASRKGGAL